MRTLVVIVAVLLGMYGCWEIRYPAFTIRYKLTLVVDDNGKMITGSSVRQIDLRVNPRITPETSVYAVKVKGKVMVMDLGEKGIFFVLFESRRGRSSDYGYEIIFPNMGGTSVDTIRAYSQMRSKKELEFDKLPLLVRFRDINDPKTVELVDPNDLEKTFGKGVKLVSATLEMTDEPVTTGPVTIGADKYIPSFNFVYFLKE